MCPPHFDAVREGVTPEAAENLAKLRKAPPAREAEQAPRL
jgi:hypothetical protein